MKLSIVICTYNRDKYINAALESLKNQSLSKKYFEIIVVNNNSTDSTEQVVKEFISTNQDLNFLYVIENNQGLSYARNRGIEAASGEYISFIDDDAIADVNFAELVIKAFENYPKFDALGGKVIPIFEDSSEPLWMSKYVERLVSKVDYGDKAKKFTKKYPVGCNMAFRKSIFKKIGKFNTSLNLRADDKYIFHKLKKKKFKILYDPKILVWHNIEKQRTTDAFLFKLSRLNGRSDRIRLKTDSSLKVFFNFFNHFFKVLASYLLFIKFMFKKQTIKGKYLVKIMHNTFYGYLFYKKVTEYEHKK